MIKFFTGDIFDVRRWKCQFGGKSTPIPIVIPVNLLGVADAGLAKAWAETDPQAAAIYRKLCRDQVLDVGMVWTMNTACHQWILFPTKTDWKLPGKLEYIKSGLASLVTEVLEIKPAAIATPLLGCGLGGLQQTDVIRLLRDTEKQLPETAVLVFERR